MKGEFLFYQRSLMALLGVCALFLISCAGQMAPAGGPEDKVSPEITVTSPLPQAREFHDSSFRLEFSEYVNRRSVEESIFLSPHLGRLTFDWGGTEVEIGFSDSLRANTTYVLTLGTDVVDLRGNRLEQSFSLPFSTGSHIDSGQIRGTVHDERPEGILLFAYLLNSHSADTLNPSRRSPDYLTQTGKDGSFALRYLGFGTYRVFAVRDEFKNLLYDPQTDAVGSASRDIVIDPSTPVIESIRFKIAREDTSSPFLTTARSIDLTHFFVAFNEPVIDSSRLAGMILSDTSTQSVVRILDVSVVDDSSGSMQIVTEPQESLKTYRLTVGEVKDLYGNVIKDSARSITFTAEAGPDTTFPVIESSTEFVARADSFTIRFSEAVKRKSFERGFEVKDSAGNEIKGSTIWKGSMVFSFVPESGWELGKRYSVSIVMDSLMDFSGLRHRDSVMEFTFRSIDQRTLGEIAGSIDVGGFDSDGRSRIVIGLNPVGGTDARPREWKIRKDGPFRLTEVREGKYALSAYVDLDGNGKLDVGKPYPFQTSEPFSVHPDTIKIRARWPIEGIGLRIR